MEDVCVEWRVRAIRGATTVPENSEIAIRDAVTELLDELETHNQFDPEQMISVTFSVTRDLDAIFPAAVARRRPRWGNVPLLDVQHMYVKNDLKRCIRVLIHINLLPEESLLELLPNDRKEDTLQSIYKNLRF